MVIAALDHVPHCYTSDDGTIVARVLRHALEANDHVTLSFSGVGDVPSSFINAALVSLLDRYSYDTIKRRLSIVGSNPQVNSMIKRCFENALHSLAAA